MAGVCVVEVVELPPKLNPRVLADMVEMVGLAPKLNPVINAAFASSCHSLNPYYNNQRSLAN